MRGEEEGSMITVTDPMGLLDQSLHTSRGWTRTGRQPEAAPTPRSLLAPLQDRHAIEKQIESRLIPLTGSRPSAVPILNQDKLFPREETFSPMNILNRDLALFMSQRPMLRSIPHLTEQHKEFRTRRSRPARTSVLFKSDRANQIDNTDMTTISDTDKFQRTCGKLGNLVDSRGKELIFTGFMEEFKRISSVFEEFRVEDLGDYSKHPIEPFDIELNPTIDIEYRIQKNNQGMSRWADIEGKVNWAPCTILEYNKAEDRFLIQWTGSNVLKSVTRMNILFAGENEEEFDKRRIQANVIRSMYLMEKSFKSTLLGKEVLAKNKIYFSYDTFRKILSMTGISPSLFNSTDILPGIWQEVLDEYAIANMRFYFEYKTAESYYKFVEDCGTNAKERINDKFYTRKAQVYYIETTVARDVGGKQNNRKENLELSAGAQVLTRYERSFTGEGGDEQGIDRELRDAQNIVNVFMRSILKNKNTNILVDEGYDKYFYVKSDDEQKADKESNPTVHLQEVESMQARAQSNTPKANAQAESLKIALSNPIQGINRDSVATPRLNHPAPKIKEERNHVYNPSTLSILYRTREYLELLPDTQLPSVIPKQISPNILSLCCKIVSSVISPLIDVYLGSLALLKSIIQELDNFNIFIQVTDHLIQQGDVYNIDSALVDRLFTNIKYLIESVYVQFCSIKADTLVLSDSKKASLLTSKYKLLLAVLNQEIIISINSMVVYSSHQIIKLCRFLLLSFTVDLPAQRDIDLLLSKENYILRCKELQESLLLPSGLQEYPHPNKLYCKTGCDFRRMCLMIKTYVQYYMLKLHNSSSLLT